MREQQIVKQRIMQRDRLVFDTNARSRREAIGKRRATARDGIVQRMCGPNTQFSPFLVKLLAENHQFILDEPFLKRELETHRDIVSALRTVPDDKEAVAILDDLLADPLQRKATNLLCPISRLQHCKRTAKVLNSRYAFPAVHKELYLLTVICGYAENLEQLETLIAESKSRLAASVSEMNRKCRGVVLAGSFEPDLRSSSEMGTFRSLPTAAIDLNWEVAEHGGWVLSFHAFCRVVYEREFGQALNRQFPAKKWARVELKPLWTNKALADSVEDILGYPAKHPEPLFPKKATRGRAAREVDDYLNSLRQAFYGTAMSDSYANYGCFHRNAARVQWVKFINRLGIDGMTYAVESVHAQKWQSSSEMKFFREVDYENVHGLHRIELHRDKGPYRKTIDPTKKRFVTSRRTRGLRYDNDWVRRTDMEDIDPSGGIYPVYM